MIPLRSCNGNCICSAICFATATVFWALITVSFANVVAATALGDITVPQHNCCVVTFSFWLHRRAFVYFMQLVKRHRWALRPHRYRKIFTPHYWIMVATSRGCCKFWPYFFISVFTSTRNTFSRDAQYCVVSVAGLLGTTLRIRSFVFVLLIDRFQNCFILSQPLQTPGTSFR